jgi:O-methyltransferase involved in polyketide biosynthesis
MSEKKSPTLSGVSETLLLTVYHRAMETQHPDALIQDEKAVELVAAMGHDFDFIRQIPMSEVNRVVPVLRNREFDRYAQDFLTRHPGGVVVHIGCGLDARFERVDNGQVEWYDLDFPEVVELRRKYLGDEGERYHMLGCSALDNAWLGTVSVHRQRPFLFLAEGVFMYFEAGQVKSLVLTLRDRFPGAELVFDSHSPFFVWTGNLRLSSTKLSARLHWGIWHGQEIEGWGDDICLLDEWGFLDRPEPRLAYVRWWLRPLEALAKTLRIYHFQLGRAVG